MGFFYFCVLALAAFFSLPAAAQTARPAAAPPKLTLARALKAVPTPADGLRLTVSAETVTLPDGTEAPPTGTSLADTSAAFGDQAVSFGTVTAIAPATMVLLNTQPDPPNLAKDLNAMTGLDMLTASLDDAQWHMLTSEHGLGLADLTDDTQRSLFHALFWNGQLWVCSEDPALRALPHEQRTDVRDVTDQIDAVRIRLGQTAKIYLHDRKGKTLYFGGERPDAANRLHTYRRRGPSPSAEYDVALRAAVTNTPKTSDLDLDAEVFQAAVSIVGLKTVGDLVARIGQATKLELYADPHYAGKTLTITGTSTKFPAADLLQAVCLCVTGTFRKVGPAYVLTDDLIGVGVRRKHLQDWEDSAFNAMMKLGRDAGLTMLKNRASDARSLPTFGDSVAVTPEEMAALPDDPGMPGVPTTDECTFPFAKLTPAQQAWMRQVAADYDEKRHTDKLPFYMDGDGLDDADLTHDVDLGVDYQLQLLVPSVGAPVDTSLQAPLWMLYYPGDTPEARKYYAAQAAKELPKLPPAPPLSAMLHLGSRRAVLGHPRTASDVDSLIVSMQKLGLNALFLDVFSEGINYVKTSADSGPDILTEAINKTRGTGIAVFADLSLLSWGAEPPDSVRNLTIDGKTSRQAAIETNAHVESENFGDDGEPIPFVAPSVRVSPAAPAVAAKLTTLVQEIAARPSLAGFVWEDAGSDDDLGYTMESRLAFLRAAHADPVDITTQSYLRADDTLPLFDDDAVDKSLPARWAKARTDADWSLLGQMCAATRSSGVVLPILMEQGSFRDNWYASWDVPRMLPPPLRELTPGQFSPSQEKVMRIARAQAKLVLRRETIQNDGDTAALARKLRDDAKALPGDGFVLEFTHETVTQGAAPLDSLVRAVSTEKAVK